MSLSLIFWIVHPIDANTHIKIINTFLCSYHTYSIMIYYTKNLIINKSFFLNNDKKVSNEKEKKIKMTLNYALILPYSSFNLSATVTINSLFVGFALS